MNEYQKIEWIQVSYLESKKYCCGWCDTQMATEQAFHANSMFGEEVRICSYCYKPTAFIHGQQVPGSAYGKSVESVPEEIGHLYEEARNALKSNAPTASVMAGRKILLNLAVHYADLPAKNDKGFAPNFAQCVDHLIENVLPKPMKKWLNAIKDLGNEANHEIVQSTTEQAKMMIDFVGAILIVMFEMPSRIPTPAE